MKLFHLASVIHHRRRHLWPAFFVLAIFVTTSVVTVKLQPAIFASPISTVSTQSQSVNTSTPIPATNQQPVFVASPADCTPNNTYESPDAFDLSNHQDGLTIISDPTTYYRVYGNTAQQIENEVKQCAPLTADYAAETGYKLFVDYNMTGNGRSCHVDGVKAGLHLNMIVPTWQPTTYAAIGLATSWQTYLNNVLVHETGHAALDQQYANQLLTDLQNLPATDCTSIDSVIQSQMANDFAALNAANTDYDNRTDHGATQNAILP